MRRILEVVYRFDLGGIESFILNCIDKLDSSQYILDLYVYGSNESPHLDYLKSKGVNVFFEPENNIARKRIVRFISKLTCFIKKGNYDVVHAHCNLISAWVVLAAWFCGVKIRLSHAHSTKYETNSRIQKFWCNFRRCIIEIFATRKLACGQLAGEKMYGVKRRFTVVLNGIDPDKFIERKIDSIQALRKEFEIGEGIRVYASISRFDPSKNHPFVVDIIREIHNIDPTAVFLIGGTNPSASSTYNKVMDKLKKYNLLSSTRVTGPRKDLTQIYHLVDCWLFPSAYEGLPFMPLELQAASVPCIISDVVTKEVDLGIGLLDYMSLKDSPEKWAHNAITKRKEILDRKIIEQALYNHGFDNNSNINKLKMIYDGQIEK